MMPQKTSIARIALSAFLVCTLPSIPTFAQNQRAIPRTSWDSQSLDPQPELQSLTAPNGPNARPNSPSENSSATENSKPTDDGQVAADLQALFDKAQLAQSVLELNSVIERSRNVVGDMTRNVAERNYAKKQSNSIRSLSKPITIAGNSFLDLGTTRLRSQITPKPSRSMKKMQHFSPVAGMLATLLDRPKPHFPTINLR